MCTFWIKLLPKVSRPHLRRAKQICSRREQLTAELDKTFDDEAELFMELHKLRRWPWDTLTMAAGEGHMPAEVIVRLPTAPPAPGTNQPWQRSEAFKAPA